MTHRPNDRGPAAAARRAPGGTDPLACPSADARGPRSHGRPDPGDAAPPQVSSTPASTGLCFGGRRFGPERESLLRYSVALLGSPSLGGTRRETRRGNPGFDEFRESHGIQSRRGKRGGRHGSGPQNKGTRAGCVKWFVFKLPIHELSAVPGNLNWTDCKRFSHLPVLGFTIYNISMWVF